MTTHNFETFRQQALQDGFDEVLERQWAAHTVLEDHSHAFAVQAVVTQGEMWLTCGSVTQHLTPGSSFSLPAGAVHAERYGPEGATYWVARRSTV